MPRKKLQRFDDIKKYKNVLEYPQDIKNKWKDFFGNKNPIVLELGCGKGEYTVELAKRYPKKNFIGVDLKGERIWYGATEAINQKLTNVAFLRTYIESIQEYFKKKTISEIWITFPDPFPKRQSAKRRLTSERFLAFYEPILKKNGIIHLKTDAKDLYEFTREVLKKRKAKILKETDNLYKDFPEDPLLTIKTTYEKRYLKEGKNICYISFQL